MHQRPCVTVNAICIDSYWARLSGFQFWITVDKRVCKLDKWVFPQREFFNGWTNDIRNVLVTCCWDISRSSLCKSGASRDVYQPCRCRTLRHYGPDGLVQNIPPCKTFPNVFMRFVMNITHCCLIPYAIIFHRRDRNHLLLGVRWMRLCAAICNFVPRCRAASHCPI